MGRLTGKVAFITGVAGGQGRAAALLFAAEGAHVIGCDVKREEAEATVAMVTAAGGTMSATTPLDLGDPAQAAAWIEQGVERAGGIDVLYNNAGGVRFAPLAQARAEEDWRFTIRNELEIVFHTCRAAWPHLKRAGGSIVNTAAGAATRGLSSRDQFAHGAAKGGVVGMSRHLAAEGAPHGIRVNTLSPGVVASPATTEMAADDDSFWSQVKRMVPLGRAARPEDVARCALFLASDEARYVTGTDLMVDGGVSAIL